MPTPAFVILGSNVEPERHLREAIRRLRDVCSVLAVSSVYKTAAQAGASGVYWNAAVKLLTMREPADFKLNVLRAIEDMLGRNRATPSVVPIDLDIALWGDTPITYGDKPWRSPSPDMLRYGYAAVPLAELAPELIHPETGQTLAEIAAGFDRSQIIRLDVHPD